MAATFDSVVTAATDTAVILYTSGTTGQAKGAELSHSNIVMNALTCNRLFGSEPASDTHLLTLPLFHSFGSMVQMNAGFSMAATLILLPRFDAQQAVAVMQSEDITFFAGVPTMWWGLLGALTDDVDVDRIAATCGSGSPAAPACRSRSSSRSRSGSTCRSSRATGSRRPRRSRRSATPTATRGRARSASRSGGSSSS